MREKLLGHSADSVVRYTSKRLEARVQRLLVGYLKAKLQATS